MFKIIVKNTTRKSTKSVTPTRRYSITVKGHVNYDGPII